MRGQHIETCSEVVRRVLIKWKVSRELPKDKWRIAISGAEMLVQIEWL